MSSSGTCNTGINADPFVALKPTGAKYSQWLARQVTLELSLSVVTLLFILACVYMFMHAESTHNTSLKVGGAFILVIGLFGLSLPIASIAIQYDTLKNAACGASK